MIKERPYWSESPYYNDSFMSLYNFLGKAAGPALGKEIYKEASLQKIPFGEKHINNSRYAGRVLIYPVTWLEKYFEHPPVPRKNKDEERVEFSIDEILPF